MVVDVQVALGANRQVDQRMAGDLVEHVVEEADARRHRGRAGAVEVDATSMLVSLVLRGTTPVRMAMLWPQTDGAAVIASRKALGHPQVAAAPLGRAPGGLSPENRQRQEKSRLEEETHGRELAGKTLFITGASRGIGLAIGLRAARDGANVAIAAKTADHIPKL